MQKRIRPLPLLKFLQLNHPYWLPLVFFAVLAFRNINQPSTFVFDEVHYVPAAEEMVHGGTLLNTEHPPLAKFIFGHLGIALHSLLQHFDPALSTLTCFRMVSVVFGLLILLAIYRLMLIIEFKEASSKAAVWLTGFNFIWFVQSRIVMLEVYEIAFALWGLYFLLRNRQRMRFKYYFLGWIFLGLALSSKWSALPFIFIGLIFSAPKISTLLGPLLSFITYFVIYIPFLKMPHGSGVTLSHSVFHAFIEEHMSMLNGMMSLEHATHPYQSSPWQWPLLIRPMWYHFESVTDHNIRSIFASGNPALFWATFPFILYLLYQISFKFKALESRARKLCALYFIPLLFWILTPRSTQYFYYYFPSALWLGPIAVWSYLKFRKVIPKPMHFSRPTLLTGFVVLNGVLFLYFLPIMDARLIPTNQYLIYMWFKSWI